MSIKNAWQTFLDKYMKNTAEQIDASRFSADETVRYRILLSGIVQGVGCRYEVWTLAQKLKLTGFVENLANGQVCTEIQGPKNKILYLMECLKAVPRIQIEKIEIEEIDLKEEYVFEIAN